MTNEERKAVEQLKAKIVELKLSCFDYLKHLKRAGPDELRVSGYTGKTNAEAMMQAFESYQKRIANAEAEFLRRFPD